jgi:hypothetical protein
VKFLLADKPFMKLHKQGFQAHFVQTGGTPTALLDAG